MKKFTVILIAIVATISLPLVIIIPLAWFDAKVWMKSLGREPVLLGVTWSWNNEFIIVVLANENDVGEKCIWSLLPKRKMTLGRETISYIGR